VIEVRNLKKTYHLKSGDVTALDGVSLSIEDGSVYGVIGYSGAGKSSLVRCLNLLEIPDEGSITMGEYRDIEIRSGGQEIEPDGNVSVKISLSDTPEERKDELLVVHFAETEPDILNADIDTGNGIKFETDSFSVYGVSPCLPARPRTIWAIWTAEGSP
jgi:ABC-type oligopeptide transport system ATPase subunit